MEPSNFDDMDNFFIEFEYKCVVCCSILLRHMSLIDTCGEYNFLMESYLCPPWMSLSEVKVMFVSTVDE